MHVVQLVIGPESEPERKAVLEAILEAVVVANVQYFRRYPNGPCCPKCAGIQYRAPTGPLVQFSTIEPMYVAREGACGDIAAMVAAKHRVDGDEGARVVLELEDRDRGVWHALVELGDGTRIDPTAELVALEDKPEVGCNCPAE